MTSIESTEDSSETYDHIPVLLTESLDLLNIQDKGVYIDATLGLGGHTQEILNRTSHSTVIGIDADESVLEQAKQRLDPKGNALRLFHGTFANIEDILQAVEVSYVNGILADLGVSSYALDDPERGFTFQKEGQLDMRFDPQNQTMTAQDIVAQWNEYDLADLFKKTADEPFARRIARKIVRRRSRHPIRTTVELASLIRSSVPPNVRHGRIHPATRVFQALRMEVNSELQQLELFLDRSLQQLASNGRLAVISFHSGEDRMVKHRFKEEAEAGRGTIITRKPITATEAEISENPRSRSAKLRVFEHNTTV